MSSKTVCEYIENGFRSKSDFHDYLRQLANEYGIEEQKVMTLGTTLGPSEAYDGLISHLEEMADSY